jgi:import receptor subunit TOM20
MNHSCAPSARPSFRDGTSRLSLVANRALKAGDELTIAFVDVSGAPGDAEARRIRRWELARGWRFACMCERCVADGAPTGEGEGETQLSDESKVEQIVLRGEGME